ncbi:MAG: DNA-processing protein DprA [Oscillospiraceae bacterium]|nr:DNA-processing protein DprA [Oscillospiraceae bacterium]
MKEKQYFIMLAGIFGPASHELCELMSRYGSPSEVYRAVCEAKIPLKPYEKRQFSVWTKEKAASVIEECEKKNIFILTPDDEGYPSKLKTIYDPPAVLYAYGDISCLNDELTLGVVGTRNPSVYGRTAAGKISAELAKVGFTIVSGFAAGIDSAAHRGALSAGGKTVAVLGCGVDVIYPKTNEDIYRAVAENGVFISEFPPGTPPLGKNFPLRNRIISGVSLGIFVAEAPLHSGALITAESAIEQERDVFCLPPHDIFDRDFEGVVRYLRDGAFPVFSHLDIIYEYCTNYTHRLSPVKPSDEYSSPRPGETAGEPKKSRKSSVTKAKTPKADFSSLPADQKAVAELLAEGERHVDELCEESGMDMADLLVLLTDMEISGFVTSLPGNIYTLGS